MARLTMIAAKCTKCGATLKVSAALGGCDITCPKCQKSFTVPAAPPGTEPPPGPAAPAGDKAEKAGGGPRPVICSACGAKLKVAREKVGRMGECPRCKKRVRFENALSAEEEFTLSKTDGNLLGKEVFLAQGEQLRSFKVMREINEANKDGFAAAMFRAILYPIQQIGALIFFVVGIPLALTVVQTVGKSILTNNAQEGSKGDAIVHAVTFVGMAIPLALAAFFCSFLLAVIRSSAKGGTAPPVVQGAAHRANLSALCAWVAMYFGIALFIGYRAGAAQNTAFILSVPCLLFLVAGFIFAPMGLLCTATVSVSGGLNLPRVMSAVGKATGPYFGCLGAVLLGAGFYLALFGVFRHFASVTDASWLAGTWNFMAYLCVPMPLVVLARAVGLFANYHGRKLPFKIDYFADSKAGALPTIVALLGVLFLYMPLHEGAAQYAAKSQQALKCAAQLEEIGQGLMVSYSPNIRREVRGLEDLERSFGEDKLKCPLTKEQLRGNPKEKELLEKPFYVVVPQPEVREANANWILLYERASIYPDADQGYGGKVNVLPRGVNSNVKRLRLADAMELAKILEEMSEKGITADKRQELGLKYENYMGKALSRAWIN